MSEFVPASGVRASLTAYYALDEVCAICGEPWGRHYGSRCPRTVLCPTCRGERYIARPSEERPQ